MLTPPAYSEETAKAELLFTLHHRDRATLAFLECNSLAKRNELEAYLREHLPEYRFHTIDVAPFAVVSLLRTLNEQLPAEVTTSPPVTWAVNVHGLENSLLTSRDGKLVSSQMIAQLNLERELLFRAVPYLILLWGDAAFFRVVQREAPDLWHWVTYKFRFEDHTARPTEQLPPLPPERLPQRGNIEARQARIQELETRYNSLKLNTDNRLRLFRDKVNLLSLLAEEYAQAFEYPKAINAYQTAIDLERQIQKLLQEQAELRQQKEPVEPIEKEVVKAKYLQSNYMLGKLLFNLGGAYLNCHADKVTLEKALESYKESLKIQSKKNHASTYHQIGRVYAELQQWPAALENYQQALKWKEQTGNNFGLGNTYHQIGMLYADQQQWSAALENYRQALKWKEKTGNRFDLGMTYHQIGIVYAEQRQWSTALENYQQALKSKEQNGNSFELGNTYYQIGMVYAEQQQWEVALEHYRQSLTLNEQIGNSFALDRIYHQIGLAYAKQQKWAAALENYQQALKWKEQTGNRFELGVTYHQIGRVYEEQEMYSEAREWFEKAVDNQKANNHPFLSNTEASLARVQEQLGHSLA